MPLADSLGAFDELRRDGKIRAIGLSQFHRRAARRSDAPRRDVEGFAAPCALQTWYNLVEREKLEGPLRDAALATASASFPFYSLANGFLTGKYRRRTTSAKARAASATPNISKARDAQVLAALDEIAAETGAALATVALAWTMAQPGITAPIASATSVEQLKELIAAMT